MSNRTMGQAYRTKWHDTLIDQIYLCTRHPYPSPSTQGLERDKVLAAEQVGLCAPLNPPPLAQRGSFHLVFLIVVKSLKYLRDNSLTLWCYSWIGLCIFIFSLYPQLLVSCEKHGFFLLGVYPWSLKDFGGVSCSRDLLCRMRYHLGILDSYQSSLLHF